MINWFLIVIVTLNLTFSTISDIFAKYWGLTGNRNLLFAGLAITTSVILVITIAISVALGFLFFHEQVHASQWVGIAIGFVAVILISGF
jgi:drug/metabolite transporter (DMT)-like permease